MHYIHKVGCTSVRQVPVAGTCSFRLTTQICVFQKLRSTGHQTCGFSTDIPVLTHRLPRLMLSLRLMLAFHLVLKLSFHFKGDTTTSLNGPCETLVCCIIIHLISHLITNMIVL